MNRLKKIKKAQSGLSLTDYLTEIKKKNELTDEQKIVDYHSSQRPQQIKEIKYSVQPGDSLSKIAKKLNVSLLQLSNTNNLKDLDKIYPGQELSVGVNNSPQSYAIVDKKLGLTKLYKQGEKEAYKIFSVNVGENSGDAQTVTKYIDRNNDDKITDIDKPFKVDWSAGNKSTGAGIYKVSNIDDKGYHGTPIINMKNETETEVATSFHKGKVEGKTKVSNGCIRLANGEIQCLTNELQINSPVYILPEDEGNKFEIIDGKPVFRAKSKKDYTTYIDSQGRSQKGQGVNRTIQTLNYSPLNIAVNKDLFEKEKFTAFDFNDSDEYNNTVTVFTDALTREDNKKKVMQAAKIPSDVYDQVSQVTLGIFGNESNFGDTHSGIGNASRALLKWWDNKNSSPDAESKATTYGQWAGKESNSVGYTQLRWNALNDDEKIALKKVGVTSNKDFLDPAKAAIGTATILGVRYNQQLTDKDKQDVLSNLPKKWGGSSSDNYKTYTDNVKNNLKYFSFSKKKGGIIHLDLKTTTMNNKSKPTQRLTNKLSLKIGGLIKNQNGGDLTTNQQKINKLVAEASEKSKVLTNEFDTQQRANQTRDLLFKKVENPVMQGSQNIVDKVLMVHPYNKQYRITPEGVVNKKGDLLLTNEEVATFNLNKDEASLKTLLNSTINTETGESLFKLGGRLKKKL